MLKENNVSNAFAADIPILIIGLNRPEMTMSLVDLLIEYGMNCIFVSLDGARNEKDSIAKAEILRRIEELNSQGSTITVINHNENNGLSKGVQKAIDWFFELNESGVILEDDLRPTRSFFDFCAVGLEVIKDKKDYVMVSGNQYIPHGTESRFLVSNYPLIWGWATSREKWLLLRDLINHPSYPTRAKTSLRISNYWKAGLIRIDAGKLDSWAFPLASSIRNLELKCLLPPKNLVSNIGDDTQATHTRSSDEFINRIAYEIEVYRIPREISEQSIGEINNFIEREIYKIRWKNVLSACKAATIK